MSNRFRSSGYAIGASGEISRPFSEVIEVQAASVLPRIGGYGSARSVAFKHREILQYDLAHTEVIGAPCDGQDGKQSHSTRVRSTIEGLNIMGMVTADRVVATVFAHCKKVSSLQLIGTYFDNLRIAGIPVEVDLAVDLFDRHDTYKSLKEAYKTDDTDVHKLLDQPALRAAPEDVLRDLDLPGTRQRVAVVERHRHCIVGARDRRAEVCRAAALGSRHSGERVRNHPACRSRDRQWRPNGQHGSSPPALPHEGTHPDLRSLRRVRGRQLANARSAHHHGSGPDGVSEHCIARR